MKNRTPGKEGRREGLLTQPTLCKVFWRSWAERGTRDRGRVTIAFTPFTYRLICHLFTARLAAGPSKNFRRSKTTRGFTAEKDPSLASLVEKVFVSEYRIWSTGG